MTIVALYEKKENKKSNSEYMEIDLGDLEFYEKFKHGQDFLKIPSSKIANKTIMEWFQINGISFWWFILPIIHPKYKEAILFIDRLFSLIKKHAVKSIHLYGCYDKISIIEEICSLKEIEFKIKTKNHYSFKMKQFVKKNAKKSMYKKITKEKRAKRIRCYRKYEKREKLPQDAMIITSPGIYRRNTLSENGIAKDLEFFIQPILDGFKNKLPILCIDLDYTFRGEIDALENRLKTEFNWMPVEYFLKDKKSKEVDRSLKKLKQNVEFLKKGEVSTVFSYKGISLWKYLEETFNDIFLEPNLPTYLELIDELQDILKKIKPCVIIQVYETGPYAKAFEVVAKKLGIKTIGIQHGLFPSDTADYMCKEVKSDDCIYGNLIPDCTFVFGEYYKKLLTRKGGYMEENVLATGNPTFVNLDEIKNNLDRTKILEKSDIPDKKIVLFPLSFRLMYHQNNPDRLIINEIYSKLKNSDTIVLVRPHPGDLLDSKIFREIFPADNFIMSKNTIIEDLFICDVVVMSPLSTLSSEAGLFEKPVFLVNVVDDDMSTYDDIYQQIVKNEIAKFSTLKELVVNINSIKKGELWKTNESEKRKNFLKMFYNKYVETNVLESINKIKN